MMNNRQGGGFNGWPQVERALGFLKKGGAAHLHRVEVPVYRRLPCGTEVEPIIA